jgi:hypothetical protein
MNVVEASKLQVGCQKMTELTKLSLRQIRRTDWMILLRNTRLER